jgi:hypothetical protein
MVAGMAGATVAAVTAVEDFMVAAVFTADAGSTAVDMAAALAVVTFTIMADIGAVLVGLTHTATRMKADVPIPRPMFTRLTDGSRLWKSCLAAVHRSFEGDI